MAATSDDEKQNLPAPEPRNDDEQSSDHEGEQGEQHEDVSKCVILSSQGYVFWLYIYCVDNSFLQGGRN